MPEPVTLLYFAWLGERIGHRRETLTLPAQIATLAQLMDWLAERSPGHRAAFADRTVVRAAVNQAHAGPGQAVAGGDEIAFFPPVTGGGR